MPKKGRRLPPVHPGEILREDLLKPLEISINRLGRDLRVPVTRISEIVNGRRGMNLQAAHDLDSAQRVSAARIARDVHPREATLADRKRTAGGRHAGVPRVPESQLWTLEEPHRSRIVRGLAWASEVRPQETHLDALVKRKMKSATEA